VAIAERPLSLGGGARAPTPPPPGGGAWAPRAATAGREGPGPHAAIEERSRREGEGLRERDLEGCGRAPEGEEKAAADEGGGEDGMKMKTKFYLYSRVQLWAVGWASFFEADALYMSRLSK
jgi:hypothetical protein